MLRVDITTAKPDMVLALPVRQPGASDRYLLMTGYRLAPDVINKLKAMGVRDIWIRYPGLETLRRFIDPVVLERRADIARQLEKNIESIQGQATARVAYDQYVTQMAALVESLLSNRTATLFMDEAAGANPGLLQHATTVSFISLLMGLKLDAYLIRQRRRVPTRYARKVGSLGVGAMLHDIGTLRLEEEVARRYRQTGNTDDPAWRAHTRLGYEMVRGQVDPTSAVVVLDHHQHFDGSGFPAKRGVDGRPLATHGESIHVFARICCVADTYDELRHPVEGVKLPAVRAISRMLSEPYVHWFDPNVLKAFLQVVPPFPPATPVRLSDGRWAVPLEHSVADPCRPCIQIIPDPALPPADPDAEVPFPPEMIELRERPDLSITMAEGQNVGADNFKLPPQLLGDPTDAVHNAPEPEMDEADATDAQ